MRAEEAIDLLTAKVAARIDRSTSNRGFWK
jgi:hypothetical protein